MCSTTNYIWSADVEIVTEASEIYYSTATLALWPRVCKFDCVFHVCLGKCKHTRTSERLAICQARPSQLEVKPIKVSAREWRSLRDLATCAAKTIICIARSCIIILVGAFKFELTFAWTSNNDNIHKSLVCSPKEARIRELAPKNRFGSCEILHKSSFVVLLCCSRGLSVRLSSSYHLPSRLYPSINLAVAPNTTNRTNPRTNTHTHDDDSDDDLAA